MEFYEICTIQLGKTRIDPRKCDQFDFEYFPFTNKTST